jgi:predicted ATP-dependent endonuclease of OLD family
VIERLSIRNFRAFDEFEVPRFGQLNLIGGANSVGKSSLLEAIWLLASHSKPGTLLRILQARDEHRIGSRIFLSEHESSGLSRVASFFNSQTVPLGSSFQVADERSRFEFKLEAKERSHFEKVIDGSNDPPQKIVATQVALILGIYENSQRIAEFEDLERLDQSDSIGARHAVFPSTEATEPSYIGSRGLSSEEMVEFWDKVDLTPTKNQVLRFLQILHPLVEDLSFPASRYSSIATRLPLIRMKDSLRPFRLSQLGEGSVRMLGLALAALSLQSRVLIVDEIENGLHHSVHMDLWKALATFSREFGVQVFATTHSQDMVSAFRVACATDDEVEGVYLKIVDRKGKRKAITFEEEELVRADLAGVELR